MFLQVYEGEQATDLEPQPQPPSAELLSSSSPHYSDAYPSTIPLPADTSSRSQDLSFTAAI